MLSYFPNLDGLRFLAAFGVMIHHTEQLKAMWQLPNSWDNACVGLLGKLGVVLFFVLSGFLITYLLLAEERKYGSIRLGRFYMRRILRILPLYYLILAVAWWVLPNIALFASPHFDYSAFGRHLFLQGCLYILVLPNWAMPISGGIPYATHTWSIGTEEQFYVIWPCLLRRVTYHRLYLLGGIVLGYQVVICLLQSSWAVQYLPYATLFRSFWASFMVPCMAIGGFYAVLLFRQHAFLRILMRSVIWYSLLAILGLLLGFGVKFSYFHYEIYALLFGGIILHLAANPHLGRCMEHTSFHYLGKISYGLYMYHPIAIVFALQLLNISTMASVHWLVYPLSICLTLALAAFSYRYYESFFIGMKNKFA